MGKFSINLDDKPHLSKLMKDDPKSFKNIVGTFVNLMEQGAERQWHKLPDAIHSSLSFADIVGGILNAMMTTDKIEPNAYKTLELDLHPLALLSDKRKNLLTDELEQFNWKEHFSMDSNEISKETIEKIIRKMLYLMRWFDVETVSKSLIANSFPVVDTKDIQKLPFQPALKYQKEHLGDLFVGKFFHDIGAFNCGDIEHETVVCPACKIGHLQNTVDDKNIVCPRCNAGFVIKEELNF